jgi:hypothetical protein
MKLTQHLSGMVAALIPAFILAGCDGREVRDANGAPLRSADERVSAADATENSAACTIADSGRPLPAVTRESSGLSQSRRDPGIFWTHNDAGNKPLLYAISSDGNLAGTVRVQGASLTDWEDIAAGPCGGTSCLYIGDIGDNDEKRSAVTIYEVPEPTPDAASTPPATALRVRYPAGARDSEAMFIASGNLYLVTKGRSGPIELYRYPLTKRPAGIATLELVREIMPAPTDNDDRVTSAAASPDGRWVGIRTYRTLYLYPALSLTGSSNGGPEPMTMGLNSLDETSGEGLELANDGTVWLSSEGSKKQPSSWARLKCALPTVSS